MQNKQTDKHKQTTKKEIPTPGSPCHVAPIEEEWNVPRTCCDPSSRKVCVLWVTGVRSELQPLPTANLFTEFLLSTLSVLDRIFLRHV